MDNQHKPYISSEQSLAELTIKSVLTGIVFGCLFGAANAYLGLTAGLTISTSIPLAVMATGMFRLMKKAGAKTNILEINIAQTIGSASSSLASGLIFTIPALFLWELDPSYIQMVMLGALGGLLGVIFMVPLRRFLIVSEHRNLPYPEGTASAEVLIATDKGGRDAGIIFKGLFVGAAYKFFAAFLKLWKEKIFFSLPVPAKATIGIKASPALLGVGYILGYRIASVMVAGSLISWLVLIPLIAHFGGKITLPVYPETELLISAMSPELIWSRYIRYIGAGGVATAGIITVIRSLPVMLESIKIGLSRIVRKAESLETIRTDRDISYKFLLFALAIIVAAITFAPGIISANQNVLVRVCAAAAIVLFAFLFVTVSSRIVGLVGVSSQPTSGMAIVTLLITSLIFVLFGFTGAIGKVAVLSVGSVVCVAASMGGDISQDLKTGYLVGTTPRNQQIGEMIGIVSTIWAVCFSIIVLERGFGFGSIDLPAPQATLIKTIVEGVLSKDIPWGLVLMGGSFAIVAHLLGISALPFTVGMYLPITTMFAVFVGGVIRKIVDSKNNSKENKTNTGVLFGSGLIAGEGLLGVGIAGFVFFAGTWDGIGSHWAGIFTQPISVATLAGLIYILVRYAKRKNA